MSKQILYLASESQSRKQLLDTARIPHKTIAHTSDECGIDMSGSFSEYVLAIAQHKMECVTLPEGKDGDSCFVLTADTLMRTAQTQEILGKPTDRADAERMLALLCKEPAELASACCLEQKVYKDGNWCTVAFEHWVSPALLWFCVDKDSVDAYLQEMPQALHACGAGIIEGYGLIFLKHLEGSFSTVMGLPLYELRKALKAMGFFV